jgi:hypothetical protein
MHDIKSFSQTRDFQLPSNICTILSSYKTISPQTSLHHNTLQPFLILQEVLKRLCSNFSTRFFATKYIKMVSVSEIRKAQRAEGPATILAIGTANPANCVEQSTYPDFYFKITNSKHKTELKEKFQRMCKYYFSLFIILT